MSYRHRMAFAAVAAFLVHITAFSIVARLPEPSGGGLEITVEPAPLIVNLQQPAPNQLVEVHTPAAEPPEQTDAIAMHDSNATAPNLSDGAEAGPPVDDISDFDSLPEVPTPAPAPDAPPAPASEEQAQSAPEAPRAKEPQPQKQKVASVERGHVQTRVERDAEPMPVGTPSPKADDEEQEGRAPETERVDVARADSMPSAPGGAGDKFAPARGRDRTRVEQTGVMGFEAIRSDIAPYLKKVQSAVEREWTMAMATRYSGTRPTESVVHCEIKPDGTLENVEVISGMKDRKFSQICADAIRRAGPFGPFTFQIPEIYRNKNLEIRWSFNFVTN